MASCSWAITEPDPGADLKTDSDKMIREKPDDLKKYVVCKDTVDVCEGRDSSSVLLNGTAPPLKHGTIVEGDADHGPPHFRLFAYALSYRMSSWALVITSDGLTSPR